MEEDRPGVKHTNDMEGFLAQVRPFTSMALLPRSDPYKRQLYDLTHSIDAVENDIDEVSFLRVQRMAR